MCKKLRLTLSKLACSKNQWLALILLLNSSFVLADKPVLEDQQSLDLNTAVQHTLQHNPQFHQFTFTRQQLLAQRQTSNLQPGFALGVEVENIAGSGEVAGVDGAELTVALSSVIEMGNKLQSRVNAVNAELDTFKFKRQATTLDVLGELTRAFVQLLSTQEQLKLAAEAVSLSQSLLNTVQTRAQRGAVSDAEVLRAQALLAQSKIQRHNLAQLRDRQQVSLAQFWGQTEITFNNVEGNLFDFGQSQSFKQLYTKVQKSPGMSVFASGVRLKEAEVRLAQTQNHGDVSWQIGARRFQASKDAGLTLGVSMPLWSASRNRGAVDEARSARDAVEVKREQQLLQLHDQLFTAYSQRQQFISAYEQLTSQVIPLLEKALRVTRDAYDRGRLNYQDWIAAQQELLSAKQQRIETATQALLNQATIEQLSGEPLNLAPQNTIN